MAAAFQCDRCKGLFPGNPTDLSIGKARIRPLEGYPLADLVLQVKAIYEHLPQLCAPCFKEGTQKALAEVMENWS